MMKDERSATLSQLVADALEQTLRSGAYMCGDRLVELSIAHEMNVSQNTVREALALLEQGGWVVKRARRGVVVRTFTVEEAEELYTLRAALEKQALRWAMLRMTELDKMRLAQFVSEARMCAAAMNKHALREALFKFHREIVMIANKPQTSQLLAIMHNQVRLLENFRAEHDPHDFEAYADMLTMYGELVTHIRYHDSDKAQVVLERIILEACRSLLPVIDLAMGT
ncbi:MAG: hypothetical protein OHK0046_13590 [Anaerolineae bacterium]